jgi:acyl carrier protein
VTHPSNAPGERLLALVERLLSRDPQAPPIPFDARLSDVGLSSISMVNLMLAVEAEFALTIPQAEITPENFRSIATIESMVMRLTVRPPSGS